MKKEKKSLCAIFSALITRYVPSFLFLNTFIFLLHIQLTRYAHSIIKHSILAYEINGVRALRGTINTATVICYYIFTLLTFWNTFSLFSLLSSQF